MFNFLILSALSCFSTLSEELVDLQWIRLDRATDLNMPFITQLVLNEVENILIGNNNDTEIPYFKNDDENLEYTRMGTT